MKLYPYLRCLLFKLPPETAHHVALFALKWYERCSLGNKDPLTSPQLKTQCMGLTFPNPVGLAAGLDKNGEYIDALASLGFGFIEVGTVTPQPQEGQKKPRLFRLPEKEALINRMGFNNRGVDYLIEKVSNARYQGILGINIGKNATTPPEKAIDDYIYCLRRVYAYGSYITINISSPNTEGLRAWQFGKALDELLQALKTEQRDLTQLHQVYRPLVIKISPDLCEEEIREIASKLLLNEVDGVIACNTTVSRSEAIAAHPLGKEKGGLSGKPVKAQSNTVLSIFHEALHGKIPLIGVGGIFETEDIKAKMAQGASLVQVYTGLIYEGPGWVKRMIKDL